MAQPAQQVKLQWRPQDLKQGGYWIADLSGCTAYWNICYPQLNVNVWISSLRASACIQSTVWWCYTVCCKSLGYRPIKIYSGISLSQSSKGSMIYIEIVCIFVYDRAKGTISTHYVHQHIHHIHAIKSKLLSRRLELFDTHFIICNLRTCLEAILKI